jgi:hypothetical protein
MDRGAFRDTLPFWRLWSLGCHGSEGREDEEE